MQPISFVFMSKEISFNGKCRGKLQGCQKGVTKRQQRKPL